MEAVRTKVFRSGNSAAVRLPADLAFPIGSEVTLEKVGSDIVVKPVVDPGHERRMMRELLDAIDDIWKDAPDHPDRGVRDPIEFPDRPGLY